MSHQYYKPAKSRLHRSELAVPGSSPKMFDKALNSNADYIFLKMLFHKMIKFKQEQMSSKLLEKLIGERKEKQFQ